MTIRGLIQRPWQVRSLLAGRRRQVRVPIRWPLYSLSDGAKRRIFGESEAEEVRELIANPRRHPCARIRCPLGAPGTVLAIRENFWLDAAIERLAARQAGKYPPPASFWKSKDEYGGEIAYAADADSSEWLGAENLRSATHCPLWAARLHYRVLDIRAHLVREISEDDFFAEGLRMPPIEETLSHGGDRLIDVHGWWKVDYRKIWNDQYGPGSWERDWCFAATVQRVDGEGS